MLPGEGKNNLENIRASKSFAHDKFEDWKKGEGAKWFKEDYLDMTLSQLDKTCVNCHLKDECGECRLPVIRETKYREIVNMCGHGD